MSNNSLVSFDSSAEGVIKTPQVEERETQLIHLIELIQRIRKTEDWCSLKELVFDGLSQRLEKELIDEAKKDDPSTNKLNRIAGELKWAKRYSNLEEYEKTLRVELTAIRKRYGKTE